MPFLTTLSLGIIGGADGPTALFLTAPAACAVGLYLLLVNLAAFLLFGLDKRRARKAQWRIRERTLLLAAALGGSLGALLGMRVFRHKTRHWYFRCGVPLLFLLQLALGLWLLLG